jgi:hypothetical protein
MPRMPGVQQRLSVGLLEAPEERIRGRPANAHGVESATDRPPGGASNA